MNINTRPAQADELELVRQIHRLAMEDKVVATFGQWDEEDMLATFQRRVAKGQIHVVEADGQVIGGWEIFWEDDRVELANIQLHPDWHGRGIGTRLIEQLKLDAAPRPVELRVLRVNQARRLYERLGFVDHTETETHYYMRYTPAAVAPGKTAGS